MTIMLRVLLKCLVSLGLIGVILYMVPLSTILGSLQDASLPIVAFTLCLTVSMVIIAGFYTSTLARIQGQAISPLRFAHISFTTLFYGIFLPGAIAGGLIRWQKLNEVRDDKAGNAAVIAMGRLITLLVASVVGLVCWSLDGRAGIREGSILWAAVAALSSLYFLVIHFPLSRKLAQKLDNRLSSWPRSRSALLAMFAAFSELYRSRLRELVPLLATAVAYHLCGLLVYYLFSLALGLDVSPLALGWIRSYVMMAALLPISFAGIGVREGLLTLLLSAYGVAPNEAVALGLLLLLSRLVNALIGAVLEADHVLRKRVASATTPR